MKQLVWTNKQDMHDTQYNNIFQAHFAHIFVKSETEKRRLGIFFFFLNEDIGASLSKIIQD